MPAHSDCSGFPPRRSTVDHERFNTSLMDPPSIKLDEHVLPTPVPRVHLIRDFITPAEEAFVLRKTDEVGDSNAVVREDGTMAVKAGGWTQLNGRRSMYWGGILSPKGALLPQPLPSFMTTEWPHVFARLAALGIFSPGLTSSPNKHGDKASEASNTRPNHCLVNEYVPGDGILPHTDGPAYFPTVATLSLGSHTVYEFYRYATSDTDAGETPITVEQGKKEGRPIDPKPVFSLFVPPRSLIILSCDAYTSLLHCIRPRTGDPTEALQTCLNFRPDSDGPVVVSRGEEGLERERRVSLTCRRVEKVAKALGRFGR